MNATVPAPPLHETGPGRSFGRCVDVLPRRRLPRFHLVGFMRIFFCRASLKARATSVRLLSVSFW